jgi:hypothetical protein
MTLPTSVSANINDQTRAEDGEEAAQARRRAECGLTGQ